MDLGRQGAHAGDRLGKRVNAFSGFEHSAQVRLDRLEAARTIKDLAALPGVDYH